MKNDRWEEFAREDAEYYVLTDIGRHSGEEGRREFFASGEGEADRILAECGDLLGGRELAIEIGSGVGRVAIPMASRFTRMVAVDISPTMLEKLRGNAESAGATLDTRLAGDSWDEPDRADLVYSVIVFQHIPSFEVIESYLQRIARVLKPDGLGYLHFDTRPRSIAYRIRNSLPDPLLPGKWRRGLRRIRRGSDELRSAMRDAGLTIVRETSPASDRHVFFVRRA